MAAICVFCASSQTLAPEYLDLAAETGALLARLGHTLVSGGGRVGMMGAVAEGARAAGGRTIGVVPEVLRGAEIADLDADELITTATMADRKTVMMARSDGFLVLPGGLGTLDELFEVWTMSALDQHTKPVVVVDHNGFYTGLLDWLRRCGDHGMIRAEVLDSIMVVRSARDAFEVLPH